MCTGNSESRPYMLMLELKDENDWHGLPKNRWGIKEPAENDIDGRKIPLDYGKYVSLSPEIHIRFKSGKFCSQQSEYNSDRCRPT